MHRPLFRRILIGLALVGAGVAVRAQLPNVQNLLGDAFTGPTTQAPVTSLTNFNTAGYPCLTAEAVPPVGPSTIPNCNLAVPDAAGQGFLRFTDAVQDQASAIVYDTNLPTAQGLTITFKQYQWGGEGISGWGGADGISFFLAAAPPQPTVLGPSGGALGYTSYFGADGLPGGWLGIGLDAFGNFSNTDFESPGVCTIPAWAGAAPNQIVVRGPGFGTEGYCLLSSSIELGANNPVGEFGAQLSGPDRASSERSIQVIIDPALGTYTVNIDPAGGSDFVLATSGPLPSSYYNPETGAVVAGIPPRITFGFAASTGSATDIHEIRSLATTTTNGSVPVLGLTKTNSLTTPPFPGDTFDYFLTPRVDGTVAEALPLTIRVTDTLPAGVTLTEDPTGTDWACTTTSTSEFECAYLASAPIPPGTVLPQILVPVALDSGLAMGATLINTATLVSDDAAISVNASDTVVLAVALSVTTTSLPNGTVGVAYDQWLAAEGGAGGNTWMLNGGSLPAGLSLAADGHITGTPTTTGPSPFTVLVQDSSGASAAQPLTIMIAPPPVVVTTSSLPAGAVGTAYSAALDATGGVGGFTWSLDDGSLPGGLSLTPAGGISGTPTAAGTFLFTVRATDSAGAFNAVGLAIDISAPAVTIDTTSLGGATVDAAYSETLSASGGTGTFTWTIESGTLPAGLTLTAAGDIAGTPTTAGQVNFTVRATDGAGSFDTQSLMIDVAGAPVTIDASGLPAGPSGSAALPGGTVGVGYSAALAASGGAGGFTWTLESGSLPAGLTLAPGGGITGTPTAAGLALFTARATDSAGAFATLLLSINVAPPPVTINASGLPAGPSGSAALPGGTVGVAYSAALAATGGVGGFTWTLESGNLPAGLTLAPNGSITGTPTTAGLALFTVRATDSAGAFATLLLSINVAPPPVTIDASGLPAGPSGSAALPGGTVGVAYSAALAATGGAGGFTWTLESGSLPAGLTLAPTGGITGTPTTAGLALFTARATDTAGAFATLVLSINVASAPVVITTASLPGGTVGTGYNTSLAATGGTGGMTWTLDSGALPAGLTLGSGGGITGTPTTAAASSFTVRATDSIGAFATRSLSITVAGVAVTITTPAALPAARVGVPYNMALGATGGTAPYAWRLQSGRLPDGLSLSSAGVISGTPTRRDNGIVGFVVRVTATTGGFAERRFSLQVSDLSIRTTSLPAATVGDFFYRGNLDTTGGIGVARWTIESGVFPPGLSLGSFGTITGRPTAAGTFTFVARVTDGAVILTRQYTIVVQPAPLTVTSRLVQVLRPGVPYRFQLTASGGVGALTWSMARGSLPPGGTLSADGVISGTPPDIFGNYIFYVQVTDSLGRTAEGWNYLMIFGGFIGG